MKQFELKFYKEWYDALSELSHEDCANAVLALLEYYKNLCMLCSCTCGLYGIIEIWVMM